MSSNSRNNLPVYFIAIDGHGGSGKSNEQIKQMRERWYENENAYIERDNPREYADVVFDGTRPFSQQMQNLYF